MNRRRQYQYWALSFAAACVVLLLAGKGFAQRGTFGSGGFGGTPSIRIPIGGGDDHHGEGHGHGGGSVDIGGIIQGIDALSRPPRGPYPPAYNPGYRPAPQTVTVTQPDPRVPGLIREVERVTSELERERRKPPPALLNLCFWLSNRGVLAEELASWKTETQQQNVRVVQQIKLIIPAGDAGALARLDDAKRKADAGLLTDADLRALAAVMRQHVRADIRAEANRLLNRLTLHSMLMSIFNTSKPGGGPIPSGNQVRIILVPSLPQRTVIVLGNGTAVVGTGGRTQGVSVGRGNVTQAAGFAVAIGPPIPEADSEPVTGGVLLINGGDAAVAYKINNRSYSMPPKFSQPLPAGTTWKVEFDLGGGQGSAAYGLTPGTYKFTQTAVGWQLYKHTYQVTFDNTGNPFTFHYLLDIRQCSVGPSRTTQHSSTYPMYVEFDDTRGATKKKRLQGGVYTVALSDNNALELYVRECVAPPPEAIDGCATGDAPVSSLFGDAGDWSPSLFVDDTPDVAYFQEDAAAATETSS